MQLIIVGVLLAYIITLYFKRNPLHHSPKFMWVRFLSWFPLGMSYAFLYMARYNLDTLASAEVITKADKSMISGWGFLIYAASLFFSGPLIDRVGGKKGMIIGCLGSALANIGMGWVLFLKLNGSSLNLVMSLSILYVINMFFQSFGAISTIKVKSYWFHVRERGTFGAIFGTLISLGVYFAFDWTAAIANAVNLKKAADGGAFRALMTSAFGLEHASVSAFWLIFYIPAGILLVFALLDLVLIKDTPDEAGFGKYETHDASHGSTVGYDSWWSTIRSILSNRTLLLIGVIEFAAGVLRDGTMKWYRLYGVDHPEMVVSNIDHNWGLWGGVTGIIGAFLAGYVSDKFFQSRRAPVAAAGQLVMLVAVVIMFFSLGGSAMGMGIGALMIMLASIAVHSILSGTATADFGGRRGAATATGIADGFSKIGTSFQEFVLGAIIVKDTWQYWPMFLFPFTVLGLFVAWKLWHVLPDATRKYVEEVEGIKIGGTSGSSTFTQPKGIPQS
jgi:OPA family glycerol-3-phosphate transporter-like MFS transporter